MSNNSMASMSCLWVYHHWQDTIGKWEWLTKGRRMQWECSIQRGHKKKKREQYCRNAVGTLGLSPPRLPLSWTRVCYVPKIPEGLLGSPSLESCTLVPLDSDSKFPLSLSIPECHWDVGFIRCSCKMNILQSFLGVYCKFGVDIGGQLSSMWLLP